MSGASLAAAAPSSPSGSPHHARMPTATTTGIWSEPVQVPLGPLVSARVTGVGKTWCDVQVSVQRIAPPPRMVSSAAVGGDAAANSAAVGGGLAPRLPPKVDAQLAIDGCAMPNTVTLYEGAVVRFTGLSLGTTYTIAWREVMGFLQELNAAAAAEPSPTGSPRAVDRIVHDASIAHNLPMFMPEAATRSTALVPTTSYCDSWRPLTHIATSPAPCTFPVLYEHQPIPDLFASTRAFVTLFWRVSTADDDFRWPACTRRRPSTFHSGGATTQGSAGRGDAARMVTPDPSAPVVMVKVPAPPTYNPAEVLHSVADRLTAEATKSLASNSEATAAAAADHEWWCP
jgi:hypothetical protein